MLDVIYRLGEATAADVHRELPDLPSYSAVRSTLRALAAKGLVSYRRLGSRYVYRPTTPKAQASRRAMRRLLETYFGGQPGLALQTLLDVSRDAPDQVDVDAMLDLIARARREGR